MVVPTLTIQQMIGVQQSWTKLGLTQRMAMLLSSAHPCVTNASFRGNLRELKVDCLINRYHKYLFDIFFPETFHGCANPTSDAEGNWCPTNLDEDGFYEQGSGKYLRCWDETCLEEKEDDQ